jgi:hypothetical protein
MPSRGREYAAINQRMDALIVEIMEYRVTRCIKHLRIKANSDAIAGQLLMIRYNFIGWSLKY